MDEMDMYVWYGTILVAIFAIFIIYAIVKNYIKNKRMLNIKYKKICKMCGHGHAKTGKGKCSSRFCRCPVFIPCETPEEAMEMMETVYND